ncbi:MAG: c-type cytochrome [Desulfuromonas sp.]|nr:c-type cytochrome [Desulfuromonas sp.]
MFERDTGMVVGMLVGLLLAATTVVAQPTGEQLTGLAEAGESLFRQKCIACHAIGEGDKPTGPDLAGVTERRDRAWLTAFIADPGKMLEAHDPVATELLTKFKNLRMPAQSLSAAELESLLTYLAHPEEAAHHPPPETTLMAAGDAARGARLYTGEQPFANGGAPCLACHGITGFGLAGGANYGPDLTSLFENFGDEGLTDILKNLPFPSMEPIYTARPLADTEQADLRAFFAKANGTPMANDGLLFGEAVSGVLIFFGVVLLFGRERLRGVRRSLVRRSTEKKEVAA